MSGQCQPQAALYEEDVGDGRGDQRRFLLQRDQHDLRVDAAGHRGPGEHRGRRLVGTAGVGRAVLVGGDVGRGHPEVLDAPRALTGSALRIQEGLDLLGRHRRGVVEDLVGDDEAGVEGRRSAVVVRAAVDDRGAARRASHGVAATDRFGGGVRLPRGVDDRRLQHRRLEHRGLDGRRRDHRRCRLARRLDRLDRRGGRRVGRDGTGRDGVGRGRVRRRRGPSWSGPRCPDRWRSAPRRPARCWSAPQRPARWSSGRWSSGRCSTGLWSAPRDPTRSRSDRWWSEQRNRRWWRRQWSSGPSRRPPWWS